jgi:hypothetical protein
MTDIDQPITLDEVADELARTEEALDALLDAVVTMPASFLPDHSDDLAVQGTELRRTVRNARQHLAEARP